MICLHSIGLKSRNLRDGVQVSIRGKTSGKRWYSKCKVSRKHRHRLIGKAWNELDGEKTDL